MRSKSIVWQAAGMLAALLALLSLASGRACAQVQIPGGRQPDAMVVVARHPSGHWAVSIVYPGQVSRTVMENHVNRLLALGGWGKTGSVEYETRGLNKNDGVRRDRPGKSDPPMSSATLITNSRLVDWNEATLSVEPFVRAFRDLDLVYVTYFVEGDFAGRFRGLRSYTSPQADISLSAQNGAFTYLIAIKDHQLKELNLPRIEVLPQGATVRSASAKERTRRLVGTGLVVLLAAAAGVFVYTWTHRWSAR